VSRHRSSPKAASAFGRPQSSPQLWESGAPGPHQDFGRHKVIDHPDIGRITLDCDTLIVAADDLRIMIYTAEPDTEDAERLTLAVVLGTQRSTTNPFAAHGPPPPRVVTNVLVLVRPS
jgi:MmyB-like transcription regulator ligand binding domain